MVPVRRSSVYHRSLGYGPGYGTGTGFLVFRPSTTEICAVDDMGVYGFDVGYYLPVVFLGLLSGILSHWFQRLHW